MQMIMDDDFNKTLDERIKIIEDLLVQYDEVIKDINIYDYKSIIAEQKDTIDKLKKEIT